MDDAADREADRNDADPNDADPDDADRNAQDEFVADVLDVVEAIPPGQVLTYGDIAALLGRGGPRQVGQVMSRWGSEPMPWWRVLRADGSPPSGHERRALERYRAEGTPLRPGDERVDLRRARWTPPEPAG